MSFTKWISFTNTGRSLTVQNEFENCATCKFLPPNSIIKDTQIHHYSFLPFSLLFFLFLSPSLRSILHVDSYIYCARVYSLSCVITNNIFLDITFSVYYSSFPIKIAACLSTVQFIRNTRHDITNKNNPKTKFVESRSLSHKSACNNAIFMEIQPVIAMIVVEGNSVVDTETNRDERQTSLPEDRPRRISRPDDDERKAKKEEAGIMEPGIIAAYLNQVLPQNVRKRWQPRQ